MSKNAEQNRYRESRRELALGSGEKVEICSLGKLADMGLGDASRLPNSIKVLLEAAVRNYDGIGVTEATVEALAHWDPKAADPPEIAFKPARVVLQDFTGVPCVVDLAALRSAMQRAGKEPAKIEPRIPVDLVIDHSIQVDSHASPDALKANMEREFERNRERYEFLRWGQEAFQTLRIVPPGIGIVHQVNLEFLAACVARSDGNGRATAYPDSLVGTDSHTTMINGLGVVGWGVGGIEAEAVMLGQPIYMLTPKVTGFRLTGRLPEGATATDLVLTVTQMLREHGVVGQFVEFFGDGLGSLSLPDRATIANMSPEYGATMGFFPIDDETLNYLRMTGRGDDQVDLVERYCKEQGLWRTDGSKMEFSRTLELDLSTVEPSLAGPKRPQDRVLLSAMKSQWECDLGNLFGKITPTRDSTAESMTAEGGTHGKPMSGMTLLADDPGLEGVPVEMEGKKFALKHGSVVIAAITSCTNTSNPSVMLAAALLAKNAVELGLETKPWVKTSLAPGSRVVTDYFETSGLAPYLDKLGFNLVGYGCTTCIGNSGPLARPIAEAIEEHDLVVAAVLSGNRNFEGRINPHTRANYLGSPPLVVAYALAGTVDIDLRNEPLGTDNDGKPVYLRDIWPTSADIAETVRECVRPEDFKRRYSDLKVEGSDWDKIEVDPSPVYRWNEDSTYIQEPPFFLDFEETPEPVGDIRGARALALLGDSVTTDHISPAGSIPVNSPAGQYLMERGVQPKDFNSYGSRRGNDRVMTRGTFANIRIRNRLVPDVEGGYTVHLPSGRQMSIYDAAQEYAREKTPLIVLAGKEYGTGSSRDWAAKGTRLLGVRAVIAESYERIHRSNLVGMGVLPLQFAEGKNAEQLGLTGREIFSIEGLEQELKPGQTLKVRAEDENGKTTEFEAVSRLDSRIEIEYYKNNGILDFVLREYMQ